MASMKVRVDFTGVENYVRASEGQHVVKIVAAEMKSSQGGNDMIVVTFEVTKGSDKGARVFENYPLQDNALWKLKGLLQAIGMKCDGKVQLDLDKLVGKVCLIEVIHEDFEGKTRAKVQECRKLAASDDYEDEDAEDDDSDDDDDEDDDESEEPKKKAAAKKAPAKKEKSKPASSKKAPMNPPEDDDDEDDDWDDDEDEEEEDDEPAPKKKPTKKSAPAKKTSAKKSAGKRKPEPEDDDDEDDDDDWDEE